MKICLIAEGSYPYVTGGVSTWIQTLIPEMPEHEFIMYVISADSKRKGRYLYELPPNLVEVKEVSLDSYVMEKGKWGRRFKVPKEDWDNIASLVSGNGSPEWGRVFALLRSGLFANTMDFLSSKDYFDIVEGLAEETDQPLPFTDSVLDRQFNDFAVNRHCS